MHFLQLKNVDFDGLFGNISSVINLSERLFDTLQDTDSIGKKTVFKRRMFHNVMVLPTVRSAVSFLHTVLCASFICQP